MKERFKFVCVKCGNKVKMSGLARRSECPKCRFMKMKRLAWPKKRKPRGWDWEYYTDITGRTRQCAPWNVDAVTTYVRAVKEALKINMLGVDVSCLFDCRMWREWMVVKRNLTRLKEGL